jgi:hypothetical protein
MADVAVPGTGATMVPGPNTPDPVKPDNPQNTGKSGQKVARGTSQEKPKEEEKLPEKRSYKIKVLDQEEELSLDDNEVKTYIQKAKGADKKFEEAAKVRKEAQAELEQAKLYKERLKKETAKVLKELEINPREFSEKFLAEELEREMMDPKDRELQEARAERDRLKAEAEERETKAKEAEETEKMTKRVAQMKDSIAAKIGAVLKDSPLPSTERTVAKIAFYMQHCAKNEIPFTAESLRDQVMEDYKSDFTHLFAKAEPEQIAKLFGEEVIKKIRAWDNSRVQGSRKTNGSTPPNRFLPQKKKYKTIEEDNMERFGSIYALPDND